MTESQRSPLSVVILAAGQGTRMRSHLPKVLHSLAGRPLLGHVIGTAQALDAAAIHVVFGHGGEQVREALGLPAVNWIEQAEQLGTGHAVAQATPTVPADHRVLVLYGDVPLITAETLRHLVAAGGSGAVSLLTAELPDPQGYGRIVRGADGNVLGIVEQKEATPQQLAIHEINTGMMSAPAKNLQQWLARLDNDNAQGEYYLTDIIAMAVADGVAVHTVRAPSEDEILGVNDRVQLAYLERRYQLRQAEKLMRAGVTLSDPARIDIRGTVEAGLDVVVDIDVILEGRVVLGDNVQVGAHCLLKETEVGAGAVIHPHSVVEQAVIGPGCQVGPFARIRPDTVLEAGARVGNFVEIKKSTVGEGSKINHLSYVGDAIIGREANIGAGCITCNYDGANKHQTIVGDRAFIGSDTQLVAPVEVGADAVIGAGSTITRTAPPGELTVSRARQTTVRVWKRPQKKPSR